jgi:hypothetical protein
LNDFGAFKRHVKRKCEAFIENTRLFEDISREIEASVYKKISIVFEYFFREIEAFTRIAWLLILIF